MTTAISALLSTLASQSQPEDIQSLVREKEALETSRLKAEEERPLDGMTIKSIERKLEELQFRIRVLRCINHLDAKK